MNNDKILLKFESMLNKKSTQYVPVGRIINKVNNKVNNKVSLKVNNKVEPKSSYN